MFLKNVIRLFTANQRSLYLLWGTELWMAVIYFENNGAGISVYGFMLDRTSLNTIFMIEMSLVLWLLGKTIGISWEREVPNIWDSVILVPVCSSRNWVLIQILYFIIVNSLSSFFFSISWFFQLNSLCLFVPFP